MKEAPIKGMSKISRSSYFWPECSIEPKQQNTRPTSRHITSVGLTCTETGGRRVVGFRGWTFTTDCPEWNNRAGPFQPHLNPDMATAVKDAPGVQKERDACGCHSPRNPNDIFKLGNPNLLNRRMSPNAQSFGIILLADKPRAHTEKCRQAKRKWLETLPVNSERISED
ncbi:hypothetical protein KQX54_006184 [Cotesia glomerata]|uniref:Uncharacterized protein n=1 Tax=Cotesia glomerata TaxID=32391 RepID=A0AAV7I796_COTGL|nr:hypothetical protein KQX54_006184 [Cotesia glomerata]